MHVMISHDHREKRLAGAWKTLLEVASQGNLEVWYSSDVRPEGGISTGEWWNVLKERIRQSHYVMAILTASSMHRPWIVWECAGANAHDNNQGIIPIVYNTSLQDISGPLAGFQAYRGDKREQVLELLNRMCRHFNIHFEPDDERIREHLDTFMQQVETHFNEDLRVKLFERSFHRKDPALSGIWYANWYNEQGEVYVRDTVELFMEDDKVRGIAKTGKAGFETELPYYPLEGRLSADRIMTLMYWDVFGFTLSGSLLLKVAGTGRKMVGKWLGWTTDDPDSIDMWVVSGKVVWTRQKHIE